MKNASGFTLIELVLALALSAVLATALGGVLRGAVGTWRTLRESARSRQRAQALFERMGQDLRNSLSFPGETFKGSAEEMIFKTVVDVPRAPGSTDTIPRVAKVVYRREVTHSAPVLPQAVRDQLAYSPDPFGDKAESHVEIPADIKFAYAYGGGTDDQVRWENVWIDTDTVPRGVKATLIFPDKKGPALYEASFRIPTALFPPWKDK